MKKIKLLSLISALPIIPICAMPITSCQKTTGEFTVTVVAGTGGTVTGDSTKTVKAGTKWKDIKSNWTATADATHTFDNWYNGTSVMTDDFAINANITITAKFKEIVKRTITIAHGEHGSVTGPTTLSVNDGTTWASIKSTWTPNPDSGYKFVNWYIDTTVVTDATTITSDVTITAKFSNEACKIKFVAGTGGTLSGQTSTEVTPGTLWKNIANKPEPIENTNFQFDNWYIDSTKVTNNTPINADVTVTAQFTEIKVTKTVAPILYYVNGSAYEKALDLTDYGATNIYQFNDLPMGYICLEDYLGNFIYSDYFDVSTSNSKTTITSVNVSGENTCVVDHRNQTITFNDYENFNSYYDTFGPMTGGCGGGEYYFNKVQTKQYNKNQSLVIDLKDYNIQTICYTTNNVAKGYVPWEFYRNVFGLNLSVGSLGAAWDYNGSGLYQVVNGYKDSVLTCKKLAKAAAASNFYNSNYMEYTYNLLALTLDLRYGLVERQSRAHAGTTIKYLENGAYDLISPYHDDLVSLDDDKSSDALRKIIAKKLDDGGHTIDWDLNALSSKAITSYTDLAGDEYWYSNDLYWDMNDARDGAGVTTGYKEYTSAGYDTIAYITFDSFDYEEDEDNWSAAEKTAKRELPSNTTSSNYMNDTFRMTMYANMMIKQNNIKNVVVDLSVNGGGTVCTEFFLASWLCGNATRGVEQKIWNPKTNSYCDFTVNADIDGDGTYDSNDYLGDDVNLYVITSSNSFSCGNMLPCNIQDNRPSTTFIGSKSGGGACYVDGNILAGINSFYQISSTNHMLRLASTSSNFVTVDDGCTISSGWAFNEQTEQSKFFDRASINNQIWGI